jgi:hypothetical protein
MPPPTLPTGDMNRICWNLSVAISYADRLPFHPGQLTFAAILCMDSRLLHVDLPR